MEVVQNDDEAEVSQRPTTSQRPALRRYSYEACWCWQCHEENGDGYAYNVTELENGQLYCNTCRGTFVEWNTPNALMAARDIALRENREVLIPIEEDPAYEAMSTEEIIEQTRELEQMLNEMSDSDNEHEAEALNNRGGMVVRLGNTMESQEVRDSQVEYDPHPYDIVIDGLTPGYFSEEEERAAARDISVRESLRQAFNRHQRRRESGRPTNTRFNIRTMRTNTGERVTGVDSGENSGVDTPPQQFNNYVFHSTQNITFEQLEEFVRNLSLFESTNHFRTYGAHGAVVNSLPRTLITERNFEREKGDCCICMCDYEVGNEVITMPCGHKFHESCLTQWLKSNHTCPVCRDKVPMDYDVERNENPNPRPGT